MSADNKFGRIITAAHVDQAIEDTIRVWFPDYIAEIADIHGFGREQFPPFRSYVKAIGDDDRFTEDQLPACMIVVPGAPLVARQRSGMTLSWDARVGAIVKGNTRENTLRNAKLYTSALRALLAQKGGLGGDPRRPDYEPFAQGTVITAEAYDLIDFEPNQRTLGAGAVVATVTVEGVVDSSQGPSVPSGDPTVDPGPWGTVQTVNVDIEEI